jgi:two-component system chemotaxis response regulator CheB
LGEIKRCGGVTIAQNEDSCVVYGMPKAAIERGYVTRIVSLENMASALQSVCRGAGAQTSQERSVKANKAAG